MQKAIHPKIQMLANAVKTSYSANGHGKASRNEAISDKYRAELIADGIEIPLDDQLLEIGVFNGEGSL